MEQHEIVAARFQDSPLSELYAIVGRNNKEREALTEWIAKYIHNVHIVCKGPVSQSTTKLSGPVTIQWGHVHSTGETTLNFYMIQL